MPEVAKIESPVDNRPLDDLMLSMDVVDTLRHRAALVERELNEGERERQLIARLREIYASQGIEVSDEILAAGVKALKEDRFSYTPPRRGWSVRLAEWYVSRERWAPLALWVMAGCAGLVATYLLLIYLPQSRQRAELPRQLDAQQQAVSQIAKSPEVQRTATDLADTGRRALREEDVAAARAAVDKLRELRTELEREFELRIVSQGSTGVWRVPNRNQSARNYYIIVEPVANDGKVLTLRVRSEEDGQLHQVKRWGLRVDEETFQRVAADKKDDGIIQQNRFGVKRAGSLETEYLMPTSGAAITTW